MTNQEAIKEMSKMDPKDVWRVIVWADEFMKYGGTSADALTGGLSYVKKVAKESTAQNTHTYFQKEP